MSPAYGQFVADYSAILFIVGAISLATKSARAASVAVLIAMVIGAWVEWSRDLLSVQRMLWLGGTATVLAMVSASIGKLGSRMKA